jgi:hypothetical protein
MASTPVVQQKYYPFTSGSGSLSPCAKITNATAPYAQTYYNGTYPFKLVGNTTEDIQSAIMTKPVTAIIASSGIAFMQYSSGVITNNCGNVQNHGVLIVGWGTTELNIPYWIVENTWGTSWGQNGYVLIGMDGPTNTGYCLINEGVSYPITEQTA